MDPNEYKSSEEQRQKWDKMLASFGKYGMAKKVLKTKSYRAYKQRWPFDDYVADVSLRTQYASDNSSVDGPDHDLIVSDAPSVEQIVSDRLAIEKIRNSLPPRAQEVFDKLLLGKTNSEIQNELGFQTNGAVRWQKNQIKQVYHTVIDRVYNEYVCRTCANVYKDISPLECPKCGSRDLYKVSLY